MNWNTISSRVNLTTIDSPCGYDQFIKILIESRDFANESPSGAFNSHLSDQGLTKLIEIAYFGSLQSEEGRYPRFRLFSYNKRELDDQLRTVGIFDPKIKLDLGTLRRLVHAAPRDRHALVVDEDSDGQLWITRMIAIDSTRAVGMLGRPEFWTSYQTPTGLMVSVDEPGSIQASEGHISLRFRGGRIEENISVNMLSGVSKWYRRLADHLMAEAIVVRDDASKKFGGDMGMLVTAVWTQVLSACVAQRHGGAFVILNSQAIKNNINLKFPLQKVDPGKDIVNFWIDSINAIKSDKKRDHEFWMRKQEKFRNKVDFISSIANVDGCVCLTPELQVAGFGGFISTDELSINNKLVLINAKTGDSRETPDYSFWGGTRHQSAFRLCEAVPNSLAFVVSQDGDLSVFYSDDKNVFAFKTLRAFFQNPDLE